MYQRYIKALLQDLLKVFHILCLTGPSHQAGKTTSVCQLADDVGMKYLSLDDAAVLASVQSDPQGFIDSFTQQDVAVVLDKFKYASELIRVI